ncbi:MAG: ATP-binding cassette domain-containing protein [Microcystis aeruginosa DA14]|uniref:ATP-binding cassette domain-containing protein n=1 Tax=Microcystis aeruginosa DA14 TaxID=1987506 RepID=A0A3E0MFN4_MICAE|nr:MAG: ATP-binding cassette domain-containing protein [Microcystis aeruginosa DA14]
MSALLEVEGLVKHYLVRGGGGLFGAPVVLKAVDGVSFSIPAGRTLGLVGESGCGKSTTARLVLGTLARDDGKVVFDGEPVGAVRDARWRAQRRTMQMVYQDPLSALDRRLTVGKQVMEPALIHGLGTAAERREKALSIMDAVGLSSRFFDRYPHELSGGQRQRVVLARALILSPKLLVCDEPISALDVSIQAQVINLLLDLQDQFSLTYLFISHDLKVVRQVAHEVAVMYLGRIVERGDPEALFHAPAHPYTRALVGAIPTPLTRGRARASLQGDPPSPINTPPGCAFHPRCPRAEARCRSEAPLLRPLDDGRFAACHFPVLSTPAREVA